VALTAALAYIFILKRAMKSMAAQARDFAEQPNNMLLSAGTPDRDLCSLTREINVLLAARNTEITRLKNEQNSSKQAITNISHDLRTPLTSALGYVQFLQDGDIGEEKRHEYTATIESKLKNLHNLINILFEFTKISENYDFILEKIHLDNVLRDVLAEFYDEIVQESFTIDFHETEEQGRYIFADVNALKRIFQNLVQNALKHGKGSLEVRSDGETVVFSNAVGQDEKIDIERIFDRFYSEDYSRSKEGTGLGLAIVKTLAEGMGGSVSARIEDGRLKIELRFRAVG
jgi:signal transduction histidine kinase